MPRKNLIRTNTFAYHIYARSNNREWFFIPQQEVWEICSTYFQTISDRYQAHLHSFVLMNNHFHMIISTPQSNIDSIMNYWMREVSRNIAKSANRINHIFGGRYKWCLIQSESYYSHVYRYVYRNPIEAGLTQSTAGYPFSTFHYLYHKLPLAFPIYDADYVDKNISIPKELNSRLIWLNQAYSEQENELLKRGLRRSIFHLSKKNTFISTRKRLIHSPK